MPAHRAGRRLAVLLAATLAGAVPSAALAAGGSGTSTTPSGGVAPGALVPDACLDEVLQMVD